VIPAYQAEQCVGEVVRGLFEQLGAESDPSLVLVVDDGSTDGTSQAARDAGARVLRHEHNRGKGCALRTGFSALYAAGADAAVSVDADGQHPPEEAVRLARLPVPRDALVLGVRDLLRDGAPLANVFSAARFATHSAASGATHCRKRSSSLAAPLAMATRPS